MTHVKRVFRRRCRRLSALGLSVLLAAANCPSPAVPDSPQYPLLGFSYHVTQQG